MGRSSVRVSAGAEKVHTNDLYSGLLVAEGARNDMALSVGFQCGWTNAYDCGYMALRLDLTGWWS